MAHGTAESWSALSGRSVLVTGHTGFKGSWLALWLDRLGAHGRRLRPGPADLAEPL